MARRAARSRFRRLNRSWLLFARDQLFDRAGGDFIALACVMKNRDPQNWRDVQNLTADIGHYILSDRPMTEEQWIAERTKVIEAKPVDSQVLAEDMARPTEYSPTIIPAVKAAAHFGATRAEIAEYLGVTRQCFHRWTIEHEELNSALKLGTLASDNRVVESLYQQALAGNPTCIIFWLKNRDPAHWRDVQNITGDIGHYILSDRPMTEEQWIAERTKVIEAKPVDSPVLAADTDHKAKPLE